MQRKFTGGSHTYRLPQKQDHVMLPLLFSPLNHELHSGVHNSTNRILTQRDFSVVTGKIMHHLPIHPNRSRSLKADIFAYHLSSAAKLQVKSMDSAKQITGLDPFPQWHIFNELLCCVCDTSWLSSSEY